MHYVDGAFFRDTVFGQDSDQLSVGEFASHQPIGRVPDQQEFLYDCYALWLQTPHLPLKVRLAVDALAAALPKLMM
jgi:hypothetical protein